MSNARSIIRKFKEQKLAEFLFHLAYCSDLTLFDYHLFLSMAHFLRTYFHYMTKLKMDFFYFKQESN